MAIKSLNTSVFGCALENSLQNCTGGIFFGLDDEVSFIGASGVFPAGEASMPTLGPPGSDSGLGPPTNMGPPPIPADAHIDSKVFFVLEMIINGGLINVISILGSAGNALSIYILCKHGLKSNSMNIALVSMAVADLLILVTLPFRKVSLFIGLSDKVLARTVESHVLAYGFLALNRTWAIISHSHVVIIAVERYLAVYFPFKIRIWVTPFKMALTCVLTHVIWYVLLWPMYTTFSLRWVNMPQSNRTVAIAWISDFHLQHEKHINFYISYAVNLINGSFQLATVLVCSVAVGIRIVIMSRKRKEITSGRWEPVSVKGLSRGGKLNTVTDNMSDMTGSSVVYRVPDGGDITEDSIVQHQASEEANKKEREGNLDNEPLRTPTPTDDQSNTTISNHLTVSNGTNLPKENRKTKSHRIGPSSVDLKVVKMLLLVCTAYIIFILPTFLLFVFQQVMPQLKEPRWVRVNLLATSISMLLLAINSSINFIIYVYMSEKFRKTFHEICRCPGGT